MTDRSRGPGVALPWSWRLCWRRVARRRSVVRGGALAAVVALLGMAAAGADAKPEGAGRPMVVKIHADWCGTCAKLVPIFEALERDLGNQALIVTLDVTDRPTLERSREQADRLGIRGFFDANQSKTGTVAVLDARGRVVAVSRGEIDPAWYIEALRKAGAPMASSGS